VTGSHYQNLESYCAEGTAKTLNTMSTTNLAETEPESLRELREFEDVKVRI
jgi:hypothetical protein